MLLGAAAAAALVLPVQASADVRAGAARVDASWHVGSSAGQYASDGTPVGVHDADPHLHSTKRVPSYGTQSRLEVRALVVEGPDGQRVAILKNDLYIPQDLLYRRTAQLLEANPQLGIGRENFTMAVTHNHSSPYYSSPSWGVWAFQDVFDVRFFEYYARRMYEAVEKAVQRLTPVRVGASVRQFDRTQRNAPGPQLADDGGPAGFPREYTDHDMIVVRFDKLNGEPLANLVNFALHPEFLEGNDLISADYLGPLERMADRRTGALTIWTQGAVGNTEPERGEWTPHPERHQYSHRDYAQAERGARLMADTLINTWRDIERGTPQDADRFVPFRSSFEVGMRDRWFPGPVSHPYPGVSSCRSDAALAGDPRAPIVGLPDCVGPRGRGVPTPNPGITTDDIQRHGIPVPENYSAPSYTGLEENVSVHLQAIKLGDILVTVCSCEQWADQSKNIKTRTNERAGDQHLGFDWTEQCTQDGNGTYGPAVEPEGYGSGTWTCPRPGGGAPLTGVTDKVVQRAHAQITNDARDWDSLAYAPYAESEPTDVRDIKGNYTHEELPDDRDYRLTIAMGMANDYNGYIVTYREYQRGDHYRKALTAWGPHSSDYMATRLVRLGGELNGGDALGPLVRTPVATAVDEWPGGAAKVQTDLSHNDARARTLGELANNGLRAYEAQLPDDGGEAEAVSQPKDVDRFSAAFFSWNGGSNFTDHPVVRVQRRIRGDWEPFADQSGEIPITVDFPGAGDLPAYRMNNQRWHWTAHWEVFVAPFDPGERARATPHGTYRFVVEGQRRKGRQVVDYTLRSREFDVRPWPGIAAEDVRVDDGVVSFKVGPRRTYDIPTGESTPPLQDEVGPIDYPDSYTELPEHARFIRHERRPFPDPAAPNDPERIEWYCFVCTFRAWIDEGDAEEASITFIRRNGQLERERAVQRDGRWVADRRLRPGESAFVAAGDVCDPYGNYNGSPSAVVGEPANVSGAGASEASCSSFLRSELRQGRDPTLPGGGTGGGAVSDANPLGLPSTRRCIDRRKWRFTIKQPRGGRIVRALVYVNGRRVLKVTRRRGVKVITIKRLPRGRFLLRIVAVHNDGSKTISTRRYRGCKKGKPRTKVKRRKRGRRRGR
jgi:hypothetical protein